MLKYNLKRLLQERSIKNPVTFLTNAGFNRQTASRLASNRFAVLSAAYFEKLCVALKCTPNDLMDWVPDKNTSAENHPLASLQRIQLPPHLIDVMEDVPASKLKEFREKIFELKKEMLNK